MVDLLLIDELNPKAVGFQMASILAHVEALPRKEPRPVWSLEEKIALKLTTQLRLADTQAFSGKGARRRSSKPGPHSGTNPFPALNNWQTPSPSTI